MDSDTRVKNARKALDGLISDRQELMECVASQQNTIARMRKALSHVHACSFGPVTCIHPDHKLATQLVEEADAR